MTGDRWVGDLADAARGYNEPPETPRERMWDRIAAVRAEDPGAGESPAQRDPWWSRRRVLWPAAVVAALAVGLTVGRLTGPPASAPVAGPAAAVAIEDEAPGRAEPPASAYRLAAVPVLERTEALLVQVRTGTGETYSSRAAALLTQTRLLLASPAADDPELAALLRDLELALIRIVRLPAGPRGADGVAPDQKSLQDGLQRKAVLPRIRDLLAAQPVAVES